MTETAAYHSKYFPMQEAERFIDAKLKQKRPSLVFIIGGGLNYIVAALKKKLPHALLVSLQPCTDFIGLELESANLAWNPSSEQSVSEIIKLAFALKKLGAGLAVLEWKPVTSKFEQQTTLILAAIRKELENASSDSATQAFWARRWLHNSIRFVLSASNFSAIKTGTSGIIIACAGPSLTNDIQAIKQAKETQAIWALASASLTLFSNDIASDIILCSDPGFWNYLHIYASPHHIPLAMPPSSYVPSELLSNKIIVPLDTGLSFEKAAIRALGLQAISVQASGSAAGTALSLASISTTGNIALSGYDLAATQTLDHVRPYSFDVLDELKSSRTKPVFTQTYTRLMENYPKAIGDWRLSRAFSVYANTIQPDHTRVFTTSSSPTSSSIPNKSLEALARGRKPELTEPYSVKMCRKQALHNMLDSLSMEAIAEMQSAIDDGYQVSDDTRLFNQALASKHGPVFLAKLAREEAMYDDVQHAIDETYQSIDKLKKCYG